MKVVHLVTSLDFGGLERRMEILSRYPSKNSELVFCALGGGGATYKKMLLQESNVHLMNCDPRIFNVSTLWALVKFLRSQGPDVLHTHGCEANFYGQIAGLILGVRVRVAEEIGIPNLGFLARIIFSFVFKFSQVVIAMSPAVEDFLCKNRIAKKKKIKSVYNPVLLSNKRKDKKNNDGIRFVFVGRLESVKNPVGLLRAFHTLLTERSDVYLVYVGDGGQRNEIDSYIENYRIGEHVKCMGFSIDPLSIALECDVVVQPSHSEGFSLALVEAMSCGLPAVATPSGSARNLVSNGVNGWVVDSSSDEDILAGLRLAADAKADLAQMGVLAADMVANKHDPRLYAMKLDELYLSLGGCQR